MVAELEFHSDPRAPLLSHPPDVGTDGESQRAAPAGARPQMPLTGEVKFFTIVLLLLSVNMIICHMNHGRHGGPPGRHIVRRHLDTPPGWGPEMHDYSFRAWVTDINLWAMLTTLQPEQQCAAIIFQLEGGARDLGRNFNAQQITQGGVINGQVLDPVSYLIMRLYQRFAQFQVETELIAAADFEQFHRRNGESIDEMLSRYEITRERATNEGGIQTDPRQCAVQLMRVLHIQPTYLPQLLLFNNGELPNNEGALNQMCQNIRRDYHIFEHVRGNIGSTINNPRPAHRYAYPTDQTGDATQQQAGDNAQTFFGVQQQQFIPGPWGYGESQRAETVPQGQGNEQFTYQTTGDDEISDGSTDTDTSSDDGNTAVDDVGAYLGNNEQERLEHAYFRYRSAKKNWRRLTGKPVRKFRRKFTRFRRFSGKGGGRGGRFSS